MKVESQFAVYPSVYSVYHVFFVSSVYHGLRRHFSHSGTS